MDSLQAIANVREVDLSYAKALYSGLDLGPLEASCPRITKITHVETLKQAGGFLNNQSIFLYGLPASRNLNELCIDNSALHCSLHCVMGVGRAYVRGGEQPTSESSEIGAARSA